MNRRQFLKDGALTTVSMTVSPTLSLDLKQAVTTDYSNAFGMVRSVHKEYDYQPNVQGTIPASLRGTLYRNGPGLFERNGFRKSNVLDGDGMIQSFRFTDGKVQYSNRFVRTEKFLEEEEKGRYTHRTWTTRRPGGMWKNAFMQGKFGNQAGVTVRVINGRLFAFDESALPYELDPQTLETLQGEIDFGVHFENINTLFAAHSKVDPVTGEWIQFGLANGPKSTIQVSVFDKNLKLLRKRMFRLELGTYMHDFFVTPNYIVFNLQPAVMNPLSFIAGTESFAESLRWKEEQGSTFMVVDRNLKNTPKYIKGTSVFMWHSVNAYETKDEIALIFPGYDKPDHFIGDHAQTYAIMQKDASPHNIPPAEHPGTIRFVRLNLKTGSLIEENITDGDGYSYEFPAINEAFLGKHTTTVYLARGEQNGAFHNEIVRKNLETGAESSFRFAEGQYVGEPVFAPDPALPGMPEAGFLLSLVFDEVTDKSFLAILDARNVGDGPVAEVQLDHHSPMSFHGTWNPIH